MSEVDKQKVVKAIENLAEKIEGGYMAEDAVAYSKAALNFVNVLEALARIKHFEKEVT